MSTSKISGVVTQYDVGRAKGRILLVDGTSTDLYYTAFYSGRSQRRPRVGEIVDVVFVPSATIPLAVFVKESA